MIKYFEKQTEELNDYELSVLVPLIISGLRCKIGKDMAVTNKYIVSKLKGTYKITDIRVRKIINYIRVNGLVPCLIATSEGYYVAQTENELKDYECSLAGRENAIREVRLSIKQQRQNRFGNNL